MPSVERCQISHWLLRIYASDGEAHPQIEECLTKLHKRILSDSGHGNRWGAVASEQSRRLNSAAHLGRKRAPFSEETKRRMKAAKSGPNNPNYNHQASEATRAKLRERSLAREEAKRVKAKIIQMPKPPPPEFSQGQMGKANRALKRLGNPSPSEEDKAAFARFFTNIGIDPMQLTSRNLAKLYKEKNGGSGMSEDPRFWFCIRFGNWKWDCHGFHHYRKVTSKTGKNSWMTWERIYIFGPPPE